jgi:hypothetical protein
MRTLSQSLISAIWPELAKVGVKYTTPDEQRGAKFIVEKSDAASISIRTSGESPISIHRDSFIAALHFLLEGCHVSPEKACRIGAGISDRGPLDEATRIHSGGTMVIPYIVPILAATGIVGFSGERPNSVWLNC